MNNIKPFLKELILRTINSSCLSFNKIKTNPIAGQNKPEAVKKSHIVGHYFLQCYITFDRGRVKADWISLLKTSKNKHYNITDKTAETVTQILRNWTTGKVNNVDNYNFRKLKEKGFVCSLCFYMTPKNSSVVL